MCRAANQLRYLMGSRSPREKKMNKLLRREEGQTFVEYAMILALIAVLLVGALTFLHDQVAAAYSAIAGAI
jgi:Flp pilus assembly pilin Flp